MIKIQEQDFDLASEYKALLKDNTSDGAVNMFVGRVRDFSEESSVESLTLEHYPAMTEKVIKEIVQEAKARWQLGQVRVIHRFGQLAAAEQIVFVGVTGPHRTDVFLGCEFIMDQLKTKAPFWKKEQTRDGERWVKAKESDDQKANRWQPK